MVISFQSGPPVTINISAFARGIFSFVLFLIRPRAAMGKKTAAVWYKVSQSDRMFLI